jgi:hypothetical protein
MKICFMYVSPTLNNVKKSKLINSTLLTLGNQYMVYHYLNTLLPVVPAIIDGFQSMTKK